MITLILVLALVGFLVWAVTTYIPMPEPFRTGIIVLAVILVIIYIIRILGFADIPLK